jgi:hypothetical protein
MNQGAQEQGIVPPLRQRPPLLLGKFLAALFQAFDREGLMPCILRNYEEFPDRNLGGDVDFLICPSELSSAMRAICSIEDIRIIGCYRHAMVVSIFVEGVASTPGDRSLLLDFYLSLSWRHLPYLEVRSVLQSAIPRQADNLSFFVPSPAHEAITSLFSSLLLAGWPKEKYLPQVQRIFAGERSEVIAALLPRFGLKAATRLVDSVIDGDPGRLLGCVKSLRVSLTLRSLMHRPLRSALDVAEYYANQIEIRYSPRNLETICIIGAHGRGKSTITGMLMPMLRSTAATVENRLLGRGFAFGEKYQRRAVSGDSDAGSSTGPLSSMAKVVLWLLEEWLNQFRGRRNLTLRVSLDSYHDLQFDPESRGYCGPAWFARLVGKLFPSPGLWILLYPAAEGLQAASRNASAAETCTQPEAYRTFVQTRKNYVIVDATQSAEQATECAYHAIVDSLTRRANRRLKHLL